MSQLRPGTPVFIKSPSALLSYLVASAVVGCAGPATQEIDVSTPAAATLTIQGSPPTSVKVGDSYLFRPVASGGSGAIRFTIQNKPPWASFDTDTGALTGSPTTADVGTVSNIIIGASDGSTATALPAFTLTVTQIAMGSATVSWTPPTQNTDGSALTNLAGFRIWYGTGSQALNRVVEVSNAGLTRYVIENLSPTTYFFAVTAYTTSGVESVLSSIASKTIN
jgi:hypothetical protein